jgi:hypothetical protein
MIDFREIYSELSNQMTGNQKKISVDSSLEVFFGYSFDRNLRLSFMSKNTPPKIESTKILHVVQGRENKNTYWTSFDLLNTDLREAYFSFCENLIDSISGIADETVALNLLRRRFVTWKTLFQRGSDKDISKEKLLGVYGELTVLKDVIAPIYGINAAIQSWGGPDMQSKDFTIENTWYEVKTIGANSDSIHISSLAQLSSSYTGHLVVVRAEAVSPEFTGKCSALIDLIKEIILMVADESAENLLIRKIQSIGIDIFGSELSDKFDIKSITRYRVDDEFPRITSANVPYAEITGVKYEISAGAINRFAEV